MSSAFVSDNSSYLSVCIYVQVACLFLGGSSSSHGVAMVRYFLLVSLVLYHAFRRVLRHQPRYQHSSHSCSLRNPCRLP